jgi:hypothetical protein
MPEPSSLLSSAKSLSGVKLETPFLIASSLLGWFGLLTVCGMQPGAPFGLSSRIGVWLGWHGPEKWLSATHDWLTTPTRTAAIAQILFLSMAFGFASTKYGQHRSGFFGLLGFAGLVEIGETIWTPVALVIAVVVIVMTGKLSEDGLSDHFWLTMAYLMLTILHPIFVLMNIFLGEKPARRTKVTAAAS